MTTTAVRPPRAVPQGDTDLLNQWVDVAPHHGAGPLRKADAHCVRVLRSSAAARIRFCGLEDLIDEVMLLVSELVTNAVLHSGTSRVGLVMAVREGFLHIDVIDGMPGHATPKQVGSDAESGRGLALVQMVVEERGGAWGTRDTGSTTWCRLAVPEEAVELLRAKQCLAEER
ncbi:ATP-binding protein [Streptomyces sp. NPDC048420]|uniref:ATP-binding protein n=1 Tax=Streptomyces sp. NPDC048420 TaxID=3155755 RepID=UPI003421B681